MVDGGVSFFSVFSVFFIISLGVIIVLWIAMPFSAFKSRDLLEEIKKEQKETNRLLGALLEENTKTKSLADSNDETETID